MRFLVLGAGSLGSYFGGMLLQGGADILRRCAERFGAGRTNPAACVNCPLPAPRGTTFRRRI